MQTDVKTARKVRDLRLYAGTDEALYRVSPQMETDLGVRTSYVIVVAGRVNGVDEVVILPATESGDLLGTQPMEGSVRGTLDHEAALNNADYEMEES